MTFRNNPQYYSRLLKKFNDSIKSRGFVETTQIIFYDLLFALRYKLNLKESIPLNNLEISSQHKNEGFRYESSIYYYVRFAFRKVPVDFRQSSIIDFGSGKGNVILMIYKLGFKKILGIEFARELVDESLINIEKNIEKRSSTKVEIICDDAAFFMIPSNYNIFFFFNPFNIKVFEKVLMNIENSLGNKMRTVYIIYINPTIDLKLFDKFNYRIIYKHQSKLKTEILIFSK